jgi:hypothetical protein
MRFIKVRSDFDISGIGLELAQVYTTYINFCKSKSEFRRFVKQGAVRVDNVPVTDEYARIANDDNGWMLIEHEINNSSRV